MCFIDMSDEMRSDLDSLEREEREGREGRQRTSAACRFPRPFARFFRPIGRSIDRGCQFSSRMMPETGGCQNGRKEDEKGRQTGESAPSNLVLCIFLKVGKSSNDLTHSDVTASSAFIVRLTKTNLGWNGRRERAQMEAAGLGSFIYIHRRLHNAASRRQNQPPSSEGRKSH